MSLVMRIKFLQLNPSAKGVDKYFTMDYMGSSEFEWGILGASLRIMRTQENVGPGGHPCDYNEHTLWYVGPVEQYMDALAFVRDQLSGKAETPLLEATYMQKVLEGSETFKDFVGWWWLSQDGWPDKKNASQPTWCVFTSKKHAKNWLKGLEEN